MDLEAAAYKRGYKDGFADGDLEASDRSSMVAIEAQMAVRAEMFGAIRRAAEEARSLDAAKRENDNLIDSVCYEWQADSVRRAIRAAIGSEKA